MTGPEHYLEAERLIKKAHEVSSLKPRSASAAVAFQRGSARLASTESRGASVDRYTQVISEAHVHATLALAAATAGANEAWRDALAPDAK